MMPGHVGEAAKLPPFPRGWFAIGFSEEFERKQVQMRRLAGRELVVFRTESGVIAAHDPVCPHLGAHLGFGGTVEGESLRCPFHGFRFGVDGACVATGYGSKPPKVATTTWSLIERHGVVFAHYDPQQLPPTFDIPELDMGGFSPLMTRLFRMRGHPQDTTENSVDLGHLGVVHGYQRVRTIEDLAVDGAHLRAKYAFFRPVGLLGERLGGIHAEFVVQVHGLGYSFVEVLLPALGVVTRNFVFASAVGDMQLELRIAMALRHLEATPELHPALRAISRLGLASRLLESFFARRSFAAFSADVQQDFTIWQHKEYVPRPALAIGDGPVITYRRWAEQFYPTAEDRLPLVSQQRPG